MRYSIGTGSRPARALGRGTALAAVLAAGLVVTSCAAGSPSGESSAPAAGGPVDPHAPEQSTVSVVQYRTAGVTPYYAALELGIAEEYGIELTSTWGESSSAMMTQVVSGDVDVAFSSFWGVIDSVRQGIPVRIVGELFRIVPESLTIEVKPDSGIDGIEDFPGKKIGVVGLNGSQDIIIKYMMAQEGLDYESVEFVNLPFPEIPGALERGDIDAGAGTGATLLQMKEQLGTETVFDFGEGELNGFPWGGWVASEEFVATKPNTVAAFQCAVVVRGGEVANDDDEFFHHVLKDILEFTDEGIATHVKYEFAESNDLERMQRVPDVMQAIGLMDEDFDIASITVPTPDNC